jgi:hypothetical protein
MAYTNENRPKGWYNVKGKGRRYWTGKGWQNNAPTSLAPSKSEIKKGLDDIDKGGQSLNSTLKQGAKATVKAGQAAGQRIVDNLNPLNALIKPPKLPNGQAGQEASNGREIRPKGTVATKGGKKVIWDGKQWVEQGQYGPPAPQTPAPVPRSPAASAPIHAAPKAFGSAYAPQAGAAPRPNTPQPASTAPNPFAPIGDVRGQAMGSTQVDPNAALTAGTQQYGGQSLQGIDQNGVDMERRRAFLDANDSMSGMKAVQNLLNKRKLSISVSD